MLSLEEKRSNEAKASDEELCLVRTVGHRWNSHAQRFLRSLLLREPTGNIVNDPTLDFEKYLIVFVEWKIMDQLMTIVEVRDLSYLSKQ